MGLDLEYIKGQTPIDEEEKEELKIKTISTRGELDEFEQANIQKSIEWSLKRKYPYEKILTIDFIKEVHKRMFSEVWGWAGAFRKTNKNIGVDKYSIQQELHVLFDDCKYWIENFGTSPTHISASSIFNVDKNCITLCQEGIFIKINIIDGRGDTIRSLSTTYRSPM